MLSAALNPEPRVLGTSCAYRPNFRVLNVLNGTRFPSSDRKQRGNRCFSAHWPVGRAEQAQPHRRCPFSPLPFRAVFRSWWAYVILHLNSRTS